jgi:hypothetical protein
LSENEIEEFKAQPNDMSIGVISLLDHNNSFLNQSFICNMRKRETGKQAMDRIRQKMLSIKITDVVKMPKSEEQEAEDEEKRSLKRKRKKKRRKRKQKPTTGKEQETEGRQER